MTDNFREFVTSGAIQAFENYFFFACDTCSLQGRVYGWGTVLYKHILDTTIVTIITQQSSNYYKPIKCIFLLATMAAIIAYFHLLFS